MVESTRSSVSPAPPTARASPARPFRVGSDGLPLLPCHEAQAAPCAAQSAPVTQFGHVASAATVRRQLETFYRHSDQNLSEMTLRIDTNLELLRRSCFARRNAEWGNLTPDQFEFVPIPVAKWALPPPANDKLRLRQLKSDGQLDGVKDVEAKSDGRLQHGVKLTEFVRDRAWPPKEFALKPVVKPKGKAGRKKAVPMAAVMDPVPVLAKTCKECRTQSTSLWRTQSRTVTVTRPKVVVPGTANAVQMEQVQQQSQVDLCLQCYLKLERKDLFNRKTIEKKKQERRTKEQAAAAEKKRLKQQIQVLKKQQKEMKQEAAQELEYVKEEEASAKITLKFTREEIEAATGSKERKRDRKHSRKDKKKKKKRRHKHEQLEDSESEGPTPMVSPAQMDGYMYADRTPEPYVTPSVSLFELEAESSRQHEETFASGINARASEGSHHYLKDEAMDSVSVRSSSRKRKSVNRSSPARSVESAGSASKKRRTSSSRSKRAAVSPAPAPAPVPIVVTAPSAPVARKRSRTKKELERERELRALGQYCPVCNEVYEDDDQNTFVCCDSCELWVHGACDPSLTPAIIAAMANTDDKYICPLCAGR